MLAIGDAAGEVRSATKLLQPYQDHQGYGEVYGNSKKARAASARL